MKEISISVMGITITQMKCNDIYLCLFVNSNFPAWSRMTRVQEQAENCFESATVESTVADHCHNSLLSIALVAIVTSQRCLSLNLDKMLAK